MTKINTTVKTKSVPERTVAEIEQRLQTAIAEEIADRNKIENLREERAKLAVEDDTKNNPRIDNLDKQIGELRNKIENAPALIAELKKQLTKSQALEAERKRDELIEQQQEIADEVTLLSRSFVSLLSKAKDVNTQLRLALSAEANLREKTGQVLLESWCDGSVQSLEMLLQTCKGQLDNGLHKTPCGPGIIASGTPIQL